MLNLAKQNIKQMSAYEGPKEDRTAYKGMLLDFGERTIVPSPKVIEALNEFAKNGRINIYPEYFDLNKKIAQYVGVTEDKVLTVNGSDTAIDLIFRTFTDKDDKVIIPKPSFVMFFQCADVEGCEVVSPIYDESLNYPTEEVLNEIDDRTKLVVICCPNNPTGTIVSLDEIEKIAKKALEFNSMVFVDEAYFEFAQITAVPLLVKYPNIVISRTFSKAFGLAAFRIGYAIASKEHIAEMLKIRSPYDVNIIASIAAQVALDDVEHMKSYRDEVMNSAKPLTEKFLKENKVKFFDNSRSNFLLFKPENPEKVYKLLDENGVRTRPRKGPNIDGTIRLTIGTVEEMNKFTQIYSTVIFAKEGMQ